MNIRSQPQRSLPCHRPWSAPPHKLLHILPNLGKDSPVQRPLASATSPSTAPPANPCLACAIHNTCRSHSTSRISAHGVRASQTAARPSCGRTLRRRVTAHFQVHHVPSIAQSRKEWIIVVPTAPRTCPIEHCKLQRTTWPRSLPLRADPNRGRRQSIRIETARTPSTRSPLLAGHWRSARRKRRERNLQLPPHACRVPGIDS